MKLCTGLLHPIYDESLSSWLARLASEGFLDSIGLQSHVKQYAPEVCGDIDYLYKSQGFSEGFQSSFRVPVASVFKLPSSPLLTFNTSAVYCPRCLREDVASNHAPAWRRAWRVQCSAVCVMHDTPVLLRRLEQHRFTYLDKGWFAFDEFVSSPAVRLQVNFALNNPVPRIAASENRMLLRLIARSQNWYHSYVRAGKVPQLTHNAARFLMYYWLWQNVRRAGVCGLASQYFHPLRGSSVNPAPRQGIGVNELFNRVETAHLGVAYWLIGIAYGVICEKEAKLIQALTYSPRWLFPTNRPEIATCGRAALEDNALQVVIAEARDYLAKNEFAQIAWAIDGPG